MVSINACIMTTLSIIILSYNTKILTKKCIESLVKQYKGQLASGEFEIILVDNASTDGTIEAIQSASWRTKLKIIYNQENVGFSRGNNIGAKVAKGKYVLFLNSDTELQNNGLLGMTAYLDDHEKIGVLGGKLCNADGSSQPSAGKFYTLPNVFFMLFGAERLGLLRVSPNSIRKVDWVSGASFMIRKNLFERLKGFDEYFFMYIEDMELCFRVKKLTYDVYFYPEVKIVHKELGSGNRAFAILQIYKGLLHFYKKHKSYWQYILVRTLLIIKAVVTICVGIFTGNTYLTNTYRKALVSNI